MIKRVICIFLVAICVLSFPLHSYATNTIETPSVIYLDDGSYITITVSEIETRASGTKTGKKTYTCTANSGTVCWDATLTGTFTYTGSSATCTYSDCSVTIYENNWYTVSKSAAKSGNTATATVTMGRKVLGITIAKDTYNMVLSCDANGNLS